MSFAKSFRDLIAYQKQREMAADVYRITKTFPKEEMYSLTDQVRRSSRSVGANLAEAWGKRRYPAHFRSKLTDSIAECHETEHWLLHAFDCKLISQADLSRFEARLQELERMLNGMIKKTDSFCAPYNDGRVQEQQALYPDYTNDLKPSEPEKTPSLAKFFTTDSTNT